jgi:hypothetical protein
MSGSSEPPPTAIRGARPRTPATQRRSHQILLVAHAPFRFPDRWAVLAFAQRTSPSDTSVLSASQQDFGNLLNPLPALAVLQFHQFRARPAEMIGDEGYLLVEQLEGVA